MDSSKPSAEIDREVKSLVENALSLYHVKSEQIAALKPDLIVTQSQCAVCAVSEEDVAKALADFTGAKPQVLSLSPQKLTEIWDSILKVADALGIPEKGRAVNKGFKERFVRVIEQTCMVNRKPAVACIEWLDPLMAAGNWVPELVELAGGRNLFGEAGKHSPWMKVHELVARDPEVIIVMPCGFSLERTRAEMSALTSLPEWGKLRAVQEQRVYLTDGNQYFNRPGPRIVESLEILAEILHPKLAKYGHEGRAWRRY